MGTDHRNLFYSVTFIICFLLQCNAASSHQKQHHLPSVIVVGSVYCNTCFQQKYSRFSHFIPGASVVLTCNGFQKEAKTNQHGVFKLHLPMEVASRNAEIIKSCSVKSVRSSQPYCSMASSATSVGLRLKSVRSNVRVFSAGHFPFTPLKQPNFCNQKKMKSASFLMPTNPFQPTPSILPPLPFQPPPPLFINIPPFPGIPTVPVIPPIPTLAPPPPPPPASIFPPLPIPPIPGNPPASPGQRKTP